MSKEDSLFQARLKELLQYDPETGEFIWRASRGTRKAGARAGFSRPDGYIRIHIDGVDYYAHRLAWLYIHGVLPPAEVDHINGKRADNRLVNLRLATRSENQQNLRRAQRNNKLGALGVSRHRGKFRARIRIEGVSTHLGTFSTPDEAKQAYIEAKNKHHSFSPFAHAT